MTQTIDVKVTLTPQTIDNFHFDWEYFLNYFTATFFPGKLSDFHPGCFIFRRFLETAKSPVDLHDDTSCVWKIYEAAGKPPCYVTEYRRGTAKTTNHSAIIVSKHLLHIHTLEQGIGSSPAYFSVVMFGLSKLPKICSDGYISWRFWDRYHIISVPNNIL